MTFNGDTGGRSDQLRRRLAFALRLVFRPALWLLLVIVMAVPPMGAADAIAHPGAASASFASVGAQACPPTCPAAAPPSDACPPKCPATAPPSDACPPTCSATPSSSAPAGGTIAGEPPNSSSAAPSGPPGPSGPSTTRVLPTGDRLAAEGVRSSGRGNGWVLALVAFGALGAGVLLALKRIRRRGG